MSTEHLDWQSAHEHLSRIAKERARLDCEEGGSLLCALRANVHLHLGFASFAEYIERLFGYSPRWTEERLRVAEALEALPDLHHIIPRAEGGDHDPDTLVTLCSAHHRAQHRGQLVIEGRVSTGLVFRHADGSSYGSVANPVAADTYAQVFPALCNLGFRERQARDALERVRAQTHVGEPDFQGVIREALAVLTGPGMSSPRWAPGRGEGRSELPKNLVRLAPPPP